MQLPRLITALQMGAVDLLLWGPASPDDEPADYQDARSDGRPGSYVAGRDGNDDPDAEKNRNDSEDPVTAGRHVRCIPGQSVNQTRPPGARQRRAGIRTCGHQHL